MDKPQSLSVKDFLIRTLAVKLLVSEKVIEKVVSHQFNEAHLALQKNDTVEISGFGKFYFNRKKAEKKMEKLLSKQRMFESKLAQEDISEQKKSSYTTKLANTLADIEFLKPKLDDKLFTDLRGLEEQADSPLSFEGFDNKDS